MMAKAMRPVARSGVVSAFARRCLGGAVAVSCVLWGEAAAAGQKEVGEVRSILDVAYGTPPGGARRELQVFEPVVSNQRVETPASGGLHVGFLDDTDLWLEGESDLMIDDFVYNPATRNGHLIIELGRGLFRVTTGFMRPDAYVINTPVATIGVRGTDFAVAVAKNGATRVSVHEGEVVLTSREDGSSIAIGPSESATIGTPEEPNEEEAAVPIEARPAEQVEEKADIEVPSDAAALLAEDELANDFEELNSGAPQDAAFPFVASDGADLFVPATVDP